MGYHDMTRHVLMLLLMQTAMATAHLAKQVERGSLQVKRMDCCARI